MIENGDPDVVEEVADVPRRGAAHIEERHARGDGRNPGQGLDGAERIAERAGYEAHLGAAQRRGVSRRELSLHGDLDRRSAWPSGRRRSLLRCRRRRGGRLSGRRRSVWRPEEDLGAYSGGHSFALARRRLEAPRLGGCFGRVRKYAVLPLSGGGAHRTVGVHDKGQDDRCLALCSFRVGDIERLERPRRSDRLGEWALRLGRLRRHDRSAEHSDREGERGQRKCAALERRHDPARFGAVGCGRPVRRVASHAAP
jgi:hypothetical protein